MTIDVTKMTSRGQVVIPQEIRKEVHAKEGEKFLVYAIDEGIILKKVGGLVPGKTVDSFEKSFQSIWRTAKKRKLTQVDVIKEISDYRKEKHAQRCP